MHSAALTAIESAENAEQFAHVGLSCRRFLERLADALYPARKDRPGDHKVGRPEYRNRLWAWVDENLAGTVHEVAVANLRDLGERIDWADEAANKGVHATITGRDAGRLLIALVLVSADLLSLVPPPAETPLAQYEEGLTAFVDQMLRERN